MFTGIIEAVGRVHELRLVKESAHLVVEAPTLVEGARMGDSVAINGACLTITAIHAPQLSFDAVRETLERTNLDELRPGSRVNLERPLRADGRLDGHFVQGHIDETGRVTRLETRGDDVRFAVACDASFAELLVPKGSVAIDGVSLTVVDVEKSGFDVVLIPHTLRETILGEREEGQRVNLEADVLGKYVQRYLARTISSYGNRTG